MALGYLYAQRVEDDKFRHRAKKDICEDRERSNYHYKQSLSIFTKKEYPLKWAAIKSQLGRGHVWRMAGWQDVSRIEVIKIRRDYFKQGVDLYEEALEVFTKEEFPEEWDELTSNIRRVEEALDYLQKKQRFLESEADG